MNDPQADLNTADAQAKALERALAQLGQPISESEARARVAHEREQSARGASLPTTANRRQFLGGAGLIAAVGATAFLPGRAAAKAPAGAAEWPVQADSTREQGRMMGEDGGYGLRSQFESEVRYANPRKTASFTPMQTSVWRTRSSSTVKTARRSAPSKVIRSACSCPAGKAIYR